MLNWNTFPTKKRRWLEKKWLSSYFFLVHQCIKSVFSSVFWPAWKFILKYSFYWFFFCVSQYLHFLQHLWSQILKSSRNTTINYSRTNIKTNCINNLKVLIKERNLLFLISKMSMFFVNIKRSNILISTIVIIKYYFNSFFKDLITWLYCFILLARFWNSFDKLPVLTFLAHDFNPMCLILSSLHN